MLPLPLSQEPDSFVQCTACCTASPFQPAWCRLFVHKPSFGRVWVFICLPFECVCVCVLLGFCVGPFSEMRKRTPTPSPPPHSVALHSLPLQAEIAINIVVVVEQLPDTKIKRNVQKIAKRRVETVKTSLAKWKSKEDERHGREWAEGAWMNKLKSEKKNRKQNRNGAQNMKCLCKWNKTVVLLLLLPSHSRLICWSLSAPAGVLIGTLLLQLGSYRSTL